MLRMQSKLMLNVGCGGGECTGGTGHFLSLGHVRLDIEQTPYATVQGDAHRLPFKDRSFFCVFASPVLEHVKHPYKVLEEFRRVCWRQVILVVPYTWDKKNTVHLYSWTEQSFTNLLNLLFRRVHVWGSNKRQARSLYTYGRFANLKRFIWRALIHLTGIPFEWTAVCGSRCES